MKKTEIIRTEKDINRLIEIIKAVPLEPVHKVDIKEYKRNRSLEQNALYWEWLTTIGSVFGNSKAVEHERFKEMFLVPIFTRDNEDYAEMIQAIVNIRKNHMCNEATALMKEIIRLTSTTDANVKQMSEYMTDIDRWAAEMGIRLPVPIPEDYNL